MAAEMTGSYVLGGEVRMGATEMNLFAVLNRVKPTKRYLTRLFSVNSRFLTMVNDKITNILSLKARLIGVLISTH